VAFFVTIARSSVGSYRSYGRIFRY